MLVVKIGIIVETSFVEGIQTIESCITMKFEGE